MKYLLILSHEINLLISITCLLGSDSVSLQGEDKAMKRYRSLNMNGDVVAKVTVNVDLRIKCVK